MPIEGANKRIFRRLIAGTSQYTRAPNGGNGTQFDSLCHRYLREVGDFLRDDPASVAADAAAAVSAVAASGAAINASRDGGSKKALEHQGRLECFVLEHAKETDVGKFYSSLWDVVGDGNTPTAAHRNNRLKYVPVDLSTLCGYLKHLMYPEGEEDPATKIVGRGLVWSSLDGALSGVSTAQWQFGHGFIDRAPMADLLGEHRNKYLTDESLHDEAPAFDVVEDMPKLYDAVFNMPGMSDDGRIQLFIRLGV